MVRPVIIAIPFFLLLVAGEAIYSRRQRSDEYNDNWDTWTNIFLGVMSVVFGALFGLATIFVYEYFYQLAPYKFPADVWWSWAILLFADDLAYYIFHRASHEIRLLWNFHVVHHSSRHYNLSVAGRQSWFSGTLHWVFYAPLMLLGFSPWMFATMHGFNLIYQFWIHTRFVRRIGPLEWVFNSPAHHRVHHGVNEQYLDRNYGGIFIFWDRLFGTFVDETEEPRYGIIKPIESYNALWINTHAWFEMFEAMRSQRGALNKLRCVLGSPNMEFVGVYPMPAGNSSGAELLPKDAG